MALDEVLTQRVGARERPPTLRFWPWAAPAVVLGRFQSVRNEVDEEAAREHGIRVVRRMTGGGAMFVET
jgi:lipoate-protein ligase A